MTGDATRVAELRRELDSRRRLKQLKQAYGLNFYRPHFKQDIFHSNGDVTGRYSRFGNRSGKTISGAAEDGSWLIGGRLFYRESFDVLDGQKNVVRHHVGTRDHPLVTKGIPPHPVKGLLVCSDWDKAKEIFTNREGSFEMWGDLFQLIPKVALGRPHVSRGGHIDQIPVKRLTEFGGGESLLYVDTVESYKHARLSQESSDWDFIHYDEPPPQSMFVSNKRGLADRNGKFWLNATSLEEMWINDEFCPPKQNNLNVGSEGMRFDKSPGISRFIVTASTYDNPYLSASGVAEFEASLSKDERECRINGLPLAMTGLIYKEFVYDAHVLTNVPEGWEDFHLPPRSYTLRVWWDYHTRLPQAVLFIATDPKGRVFVYDELFDDNLIDPVAKSILAKTKDHFVADFEIDPFAVIPHPVTNESIVDELMKYDLYFDKATKDLTTGIIKVRERLKERDPQGNPTIYFSPRLTQTFYEFSHYIYDLKKNEPKDADNHMMENLYRAILNGLQYVEPPKKYVPKPFVIKDNVDLLTENPGSLK
ncbi:MAG TPA: hypothetical protein VFQ43_14575 [Nitrososphaera sp.]|nr:hypothetical protein [Nitrososphaera sp.]